jgi:polyisoprenoid-binding protein YceI
MKKILLSLFIILSTITAFAQAKHTVTRSSITFQIKNLGVNTGGSFSGFRGDIQFDPQHLDESRIEASIDTKTINTDNETRDHHLKSDSYFDTEKYPSITMRSVSFKHKSGNNYSGIFNLTIKDKTNEVELPFTYTEAGNTASFKGTLKIKRTDYGVGSGSMIMSNDVIVLIEADVTK